MIRKDRINASIEFEEGLRACANFPTGAVKQ
jgi:hypothetical protein